MKIAVLGDNEVVAARLVDVLRNAGHCAPSIAGLSREQVENAIADALVVVDFTRRLSHRRRGVSAYVRSHTSVVPTARLARTTHYVVISDVGADRLEGSYFRAQRAHEHLIASSFSAHTVVRMTSCFEDVECLVRHASQGGVARLPATLMQPIGADNAVCVLARIVLDAPQNRVFELAGPEAIELAELAREWASAREIPLRLLIDRETLYLGAPVERRSLLPGVGALLGADTFAEWLRRSIPPG